MDKLLKFYIDGEWVAPHSLTPCPFSTRRMHSKLPRLHW